LWGYLIVEREMATNIAPSEATRSEWVTPEGVKEWLLFECCKQVAPQGASVF